MSECEFFVKSWSKQDRALIERCSLTGRQCFCEGVTPLMCTRRTFALDYEKRHQCHIGSKITVVCSEDRPQVELPPT